MKYILENFENSLVELVNLYAEKRNLGKWTWLDGFECQEVLFEKQVDMVSIKNIYKELSEWES